MSHLVDTAAAPKNAIPHPKRGWLSTFASTTIVCGVLIGAAWWLLTSQHGSSDEHSQRSRETGPIAVTVAEVTPRVVQRTVTVVGSLYGQEEIEIRPKVEGRVIEIAHEIGDRVSTGDVLLRIERKEFELAVAEAQRSLELELSKLGLKELPGKDFDPNQLPAVVKARVEEQNALSRLNRVRDLSKRQVLTGEELETAETNYTVAHVHSQQTRIDAQSMLVAVQHRQAALNTAMQRLSETDVVVPGGRRSGSAAERQEYVVASRSAAVGEIISTMPGGNSTMFKLVIDNPLKLLTTLPERHRAEIELGQSVDLHVEYAPGTTFPGKVARINPVVDRATRTFEVEISVPNDDRRLSPGSFVRASISTHADDRAPTVPEQSLVTLAGVTKVFVIQDGIAHAVPVKPMGRIPVAGSRYQEIWYEIDAEIPARSAVVTSGFSQLSEGSPVRIRTEGVAARDQEPHP